MQTVNASSQTITTLTDISVDAYCASNSLETSSADQISRLGRREARRIATPIARKLVRGSESGFTLIEVLVAIAIAIVGILAVIAVPQYLDFTRRATFTELIQAAAPIRQSVELAVQTRGVTDIETLDSGALGIPATVAAAVAAHGSTVADGVITMTWRDDGTNLDGVTYTLTPNGVVPPIDWTIGGTCLAQNVCQLIRTMNTVWRPRRRIGNRLASHSRSAHAASHLSTWLAAMGCTQHRIIY